MTVVKSTPSLIIQFVWWYEDGPVLSRRTSWNRLHDHNAGHLLAPRNRSRSPLALYHNLAEVTHSYRRLHFKIWVNINIKHFRHEGSLIFSWNRFRSTSEWTNSNKNGVSELKDDQKTAEVGINSSDRSRPWWPSGRRYSDQSAAERTRFFVLSFETPLL